MKQRYSSTDQNPLDHILLSTGNVNRSYLVRDLVFATDEKKIHLFASDTDTDTLFQDIIIKLKDTFCIGYSFAIIHYFLDNTFLTNLALIFSFCTILA